eukprot:TRINITY_DN14347_c0_g1_i2.p1 TRINITY_DN14347_c0_g1~~TRINITY_DN14347_c0_g1_i2.p1  ORF type:complete len:239 (-),score=27.52 TRINITY_DN14347_c0_g1_i2:92-808(-)
MGAVTSTVKSIFVGDTSPVTSPEENAQHPVQAGKTQNSVQGENPAQRENAQNPRQNEPQNQMEAAKASDPEAKEPVHEEIKAEAPVEAPKQMPRRVLSIVCESVLPSLRALLHEFENRFEISTGSNVPECAVCVLIYRNADKNRVLWDENIIPFCQRLLQGVSRPTPVFLIVARQSNRGLQPAFCNPEQKARLNELGVQDYGFMEFENPKSDFSADFESNNHCLRKLKDLIATAASSS